MRHSISLVSGLGITMGNASFEYDGNIGHLNIITHFNQAHTIACEKQSDEFFRLGGTAINEIMVYEGVILNLNQQPTLFRAFKNEADTFVNEGILSPEIWEENDLHCYVHEYYPLDMEGNPPQWLITKKPIANAHHIFVNLDILDGGGNLIKRYRVSTFTGDFKVMDLING
jgi:hypothetical protein